MNIFIVEDDRTIRDGIVEFFSEMGYNVFQAQDGEEALKSFEENENKVLSREQILDNVWYDSDEAPYDRVVDVYIKNLRKKLKLDCIVTVKNVGYKLTLK